MAKGKSDSIPSLTRAVADDGAAAYRAAIAAQIEGKDASDAWDAWEQDTAALLLVSWAAGAAASLQGAGVPIPKSSVVRFDAEERSMLAEFAPGPSREVVARFMEMVPLTRARWNELIARAFEAAKELRKDEEQTAVQKMADRSPALRALLFPGQLPTEVQIRRIPQVAEVARTGFFVTGLSKAKTAQLRKLLGKVVRGQTTMTEAGKTLKSVGIPQFIEEARDLLKVGEDLTDARLETVYRTNLNRAQTQGRLDICRDETVKKFVPLMRYSATKDKRTRETHKAMDGYIATTEMIDGMGIATPGGFACRCVWVPVPISVATSSGWVDADGAPDFNAIRAHNGARQRLIDTGQFPDPGFIAG